MKRKYLTNIAFYFFLLPLSFLLVSCSPTEPEDNIEPGRRDYVWQTDTLYSPNNVLGTLCGFAPNDLWIVGSGGITPYDGCWHYDGNEWDPYQQVLFISSDCIFGLKGDDIWMGGEAGKIFHYDGRSWKLFYQHREDICWHITDIWGKSTNDLYAVGLLDFDASNELHSFILHYDGVKWQEIYQTDFDTQFSKIRINDTGIVYIFGYTSDEYQQPDRNVFYEFKDGKVKEIFARENGIKWISMYMIGEKLYFIIEENICRYVNGHFQKVFSIDDPNFGYAVFGRHEKDVFVSMIDGLAHYNGSNLEYLYRWSSPHTMITKTPVIFEKEAFFAIHDFWNGENIILHGTLKN